MRLKQLERIRTLPYPGRITVKKGQNISADTPVAILDYVPGKVYRVPVAKLLSLPNEQLEAAIVVSLGDRVKKGQVLAVNNVLYQPSVCTSPIDGVVGIVSKHLGKLYLRDYIPLDNNVADDLIFDLAKMYPDKPKKIIERGILIKPGDKISPNQILARLSMKQYVVCNSYGQVMSTDDLKIVISSYKINSNLHAYLPGKVTEIIHREGVMVRGEVYQIQGVYGLGGERQGHLRVVGDINHRLTVRDISQADQDKILFAAGGVDVSALQKANELGVGAVITSTMSFADVKNYAGIDFVPGITGGENITTGLMLLNGFKYQTMEVSLFNFIKQYDNDWVSMMGTTHIRAGALRPELILPQKAGVSSVEEAYDDVLQVGSHVEVKRSGALHGKKGVIIEILSKPVVLPSLVKALVARVDIGGLTYQIPLTNLVVEGRK